MAKMMGSLKILGIEKINKLKIEAISFFFFIIFFTLKFELIEKFFSETSIQENLWNITL